MDTGGVCQPLLGQPQRFRWANQHIKKYEPKLTKKQRHRKARATMASVNAAGPERIVTAQRLMREVVYEKHGMFCAAGVRDDILMWSHYAANHTGICVGIGHAGLNRLAGDEFEQQRRVEVYQVSYQDEFARRSYFYHPRYDEYKAWYAGVIATKSSHWSYEKEYRLVTWDGTRRLFERGPGLVSEVVLGCRITPDDEARVLNALAQSGSRATVHRARRHESRFELQIEPDPAPPQM